MSGSGLTEKVLIVGALMTILFTSCMSCVTHIKRTVYVPDTTEHVQYRESVVRLKLTPGPKGHTDYQATGFAITPDHLITAGHFCDRQAEKQKVGMAGPEMDVEVADPTGKIFPYTKAKVLASAKDMDACILESKDHKLTPLPLLGDMDPIQTEDKITVIGAPRGFFPVRVDGRVVARNGDESLFDVSSQSLMVLSVDIQPGSSGSPVIWNGHCIGIVVKYISKLHNGTLSTRGDHVVDFVSRHLDLDKLNKGD